MFFPVFFGFFHLTTYSSFDTLERISIFKKGFFMPQVIFLFMHLIFSSFVYSLPPSTSCSEIKAILFDCDGTLVDTEEVVFLAWVHAFDKQGYQLSREEYLELMKLHAIAGHPNSISQFAKIGAMMLAHDCEHALLKDMHKYCDRLHEAGFPPIEPTVNLLHRLGQQKQSLGLKLGLASGNIKKNINRHLKSINVDRYFDVIVSGADDLHEYVDAEGTNKPKPYVYLHAAKLLGLSCEECVAIEDSQTGVLAAAAAGCITIAVPNAATLLHDFSKADIVINSFSDMHVNEFILLISKIKTSKHALQHTVD